MFSEICKYNKDIFCFISLFLKYYDLQSLELLGSIKIKESKDSSTEYLYFWSFESYQTFQKEAKISKKSINSLHLCPI